MREKRTKVDFSKHTHRVEIYKNEKNKEIRIDHFQVGDSSTNYLQFINTERTMTVTGDYGNWVFCRPFIPSNEGFVSDGYWIEKLQILSEQKLDKLDLDAIHTKIENLIKKELEDYGYDGDELTKLEEWFSELLEYTDDEIDYLHFARDYPSELIDFDMIPTITIIPVWLNIIFDAFDEICQRIS